MKGIKSTLPLLLFFSIILYVYLVFLPVTYNYDGTVFSHYLRYALLKSDVQSILQLHHLLYFPLSYVTYKTANTLFAYQPLEYFHLQMLSLLFAVLSLIFIYKILKAIKIPVFYQYSGIFLIAFSNLFWIQAVEAEVHMAGLFFIISGIYFLWFKDDSPKNLVISALLLSLSTGFHLINGLITISVLAAFIVRKVKFKRIFHFYLLYTLFFSLPYIFLKITARIPLLATARDILIGKGKLTGYTYTGTSLSRWKGLSANSLLHNATAVKNSILSPESDILGFILLFLMLLLPIIIWKQSKNHAVQFLYFIWALPFFIFFNFWQPGNSEFKLNVVVPILLAFTFALQTCAWQKWLRPALVGLILLIGSWNLFMAIIPQNRLTDNSNYQLALAINEQTESNSTIVIAGSGKNSYLYGKIYLPYFALRNTIVLDWRLGKKFTCKDLAKEINQLIGNNKRVYLLSEIADLTPTLTSLLRFHKIPLGEYKNFLNRLNLGDKIALLQNYFLIEVKSTIIL